MLEAREVELPLEEAHEVVAEGERRTPRRRPTSGSARARRPSCRGRHQRRSRRRRRRRGASQGARGGACSVSSPRPLAHGNGRARFSPEDAQAMKRVRGSGDHDDRQHRDHEPERRLPSPAAIPRGSSVARTAALGSEAGARVNAVTGAVYTGTGGSANRRGVAYRCTAWRASCFCWAEAELDGHFSTYVALGVATLSAATARGTSTRRRPRATASAWSSARLPWSK